MKNNTKAIILALICTIIVSVAQILLKLASADFSIMNIFQQIYNIPLVLGAILYFFGAILFIYAFRLGELSVVYPLMASGYILVTILSVYFLGEVITLQKMIGIIFIGVGVVFIGRGGNK
ncbi:EamA family transporter [Candidatus Woesearchaeota archaeon]|nr:EamA family transporter [Candidatus Woesearchaeota archaeon]